ncbi:23S rRNA (pseudouridine(1915)-N(3))-methyltransferase RlmH [Hydrocarboniphaga sp.]|uniref:23S rRNA (pseudouridine(1915)-N(3))-methyltransferase RlmH n=1 Tax=Hydrocarboniphaga sp. TaxID=2033016 RepID=UPI003D148887
MRLRLIAIGGRMPDWVQTAFDDYVKRLPREVRLELVEIPLATRGKNADIARARQLEGERVLKALPDGVRSVALDERGASWSSVDLADQLKRWQQDGRDVALLVGGPDGHAPDVLKRAEQKWSLSPLTLPHALVRVLIAEQIYRATTLLAGHPYHRA